jgi:hypothetical protein
LLALAGLFCGCANGEAIPAEYLKIEVSAPEAVTVGKGFPLTVTRTWSKDLRPGETGEELLPPLRLELTETERRENDTHVREVRRYLAYCFTPGEQEVYAPSLAASPVLGGADLRVEGNRLALTVQGTIDPGAPGRAELPGRPIEPDHPWRNTLVAATAILVAAWFGRRRRPAGHTPEAEAEPAPPLAELALAELQRLRGSTPEGRAGIQAFYVAASGIVRRYLGARFSFHARERTAEELEALPDLAGCRSGLRDFFGHADLVKFARHDPTAAERERMMDSAERLVRATGEA